MSDRGEGERFDGGDTSRIEALLGRAGAAERERDILAGKLMDTEDEVEVGKRSIRSGLERERELHATLARVREWARDYPKTDNVDWSEYIKAQHDVEAILDGEGERCNAVGSKHRTDYCPVHGHRGEGERCPTCGSQRPDVAAPLHPSGATTPCSDSFHKEKQ